MSNAQIALTIIGAVLGSNALAVFVTLYFTRTKTRAETGKLTADAHKTEAEATGEWSDNIRTVLSDLSAAVKGLTECQKEKAAEAIRRQETEADNRQLKSANEHLSKQNTELQEMVTELRGQIREGI